jgi:tetratricopeptide (TPR) repeat protein
VPQTNLGTTAIRRGVAGGGNMTLTIVRRPSLIAFLVFASLSVWPAHARPQESDWVRRTSAGLGALQAGQYQKAEKELKAALQKAEKFDQGDGRLAASLENLSNLYLVKKDYSMALVFEARLLDLREKTPGPNHQTVAVSLYKVGVLYWKTGKLVCRLSGHVHLPILRN